MSVGSAVQILGPSTGGIRRHVALLAERLAVAGVAAPVVGPAGVMQGVGPQDGVVRVPQRPEPMGLWRARRDLAPWRAGADLVHAHGLKAAWCALGGRPRRPLVLTVHNVVLEESAGRTAGLQRRLERAVLGRADRVIALTSTMAVELADHVSPERLRVALPASPPPVPGEDRAEVRRRLGVPPEAPMAVCVARLHPQKDLPTLLRAWERVHRTLPEAVLVVVGEGPQREELEALHARLDLGDSARLIGPRPHAVDELAAADVAVMTSIWEGAALVLAEALQLGLPVVSTPVGLAPELLGGDSGGVLVPVGDDEAVAAALVELLGDPARGSAIGAAGAETARVVFDPDVAVAAIVSVYNEVT